MNSLIKTAVCSAIAAMFLAACGGGGGGSSDAGNSGSGSGSGTGGPVTPPVVTAQADILMGETGGAAYLDGQGDTARFFYLKDITADSKGNIYVADGSTIRKITADGVVTTLAGKSGEYGYQDGTGSDARFKAAFSVVVDSQDNVFVYDLDSIRKITPAGIVTTLISFKVSDPNSPLNYYKEDLYTQPPNMVIDSKDNLYFQNLHQRIIKKVSPSGAVSDFAGPGNTFIGGKPNNIGTDYLSYIGRLNIDNNDKIYVKDLQYSVEICISQDRTLTINSDLDRNLSYDTQGFQRYDKKGNVYRTEGHAILMQSTDNILKFVAGRPGDEASSDGIGINATLQKPLAMFPDTKGNLLFIDGNAIRKADTAGNVSTIAGKNIFIPERNIPFESALPIVRLTGLVAGPDQTLYVADISPSTERVRKYDLKNKVFTTTYQSYEWEDGPNNVIFKRPVIKMSNDPSGNTYLVHNNKNSIYLLDKSGALSRISGKNPNVQDLSEINDVTVSKSGKVFIQYSGNAIAQFNADGTYTEIAGNTAYAARVDGTGKNARFSSITDLVADSQGNVFVLENQMAAIRKVSSNGQTTLYAGSYTKKGHKDGALTDAAFQCPASITVDEQDNLYVADTCDNAIRKISTDGKVSTIEPQWTTASGLKSRVIPAPRRVFWVNGKLHVFAGGDAREIGGAIFQLTLN